jgi:hypothetical protein
MIGAASKPRPLTSIVVFFLVFAACVPGRAWASGPAVATADKTTSSDSPGETPDSGSRLMVMRDFNHDGFPDLIVGDEDGALLLFLGDGRGNLVPAGEVAHLDSVVSIVVADFNHDGIPDLAVSDWRASTVKVLLGTGNGTFQSGWSSPLRLAGTTPHLSAADFNGDGVTDLAVVYSDDDGDTFDVMLGDGHGGFSQSPQLSLVKDPNAHCAP